ncbi:Homocysteine S-methyltransferase [Daedalea quercina L-15889]|uniref:Homocysteine S-methyltransferase n=1 Tax=Daedalea quercina L-15889 TaxID=1314783 RepID=A0A165KJI9_9APHY|nr:Homocysteine S-methyltransferase [Daedalea quercina L-15889]
MLEHPLNRGPEAVAGADVSGNVGRNKIMVLDGGLGTTLEGLFKQDISSSLWSAKPVDEDPDVIIQAHLAFLRAGANVILTSSYQCAFETFATAGYAKEDTQKIMRKSVKLAHEARCRFWEEQQVAGRAKSAVKIALSLGPFGATLSPAQEFDGFYPPPYGPKGYTANTEEQNTNAFSNTPEGQRLAVVSVEKLADFHLGRLCVFADDAKTWEMIDLIAFETVPLSREVEAIRKAVRRLQQMLPTQRMDMKQWWVSTVWPDGRSPEEREPGGGRLSVEEMARALLGDCVHDTLVSSQLPRPWGIGINCTSLDHLPLLLAEFTSATRDLCSSLLPPGDNPWLVVYPNGGDTYDVVRRTWVPTNGGKGEDWATKFWEVVEGVMAGASVWGGIILGGCCRTGPPEIEALAKRINATQP